MRQRRRWVACAAFVLTMVLGPAARAEGVNGLLAGVNGLLTFPADPVINVIEPPESFEDLPVHQVTSRVFGLLAGTLKGAYRAAIGATDIVFTPFWVFQTLSPEARFEIIPFYEIEYEG